MHPYYATRLSPKQFQNFSLWPASKLVRVTRRQRCPICDHSRWCSVAEDGSLAICMRIEAGSLKPTRNGGWAHLLDDRPLQPIRPRRIDRPQPPRVASVGRRHIAYSALLEALPLAGRHADDLLRRGLDDLAIVRAGYATLDRDRRRMAQIIEDLAVFDDFANVPGFYRRSDAWRLNIEAAPGYLIPVRDVERRIQALQIRRDRGVRYLWLSSAGRPGGASSGAPIHYARPDLHNGQSIILTEGPLKADVVAHLMGVAVVAVAGVSSFDEDLGLRLRRDLPGLANVQIAFDADWRQKEPVAKALQRASKIIMRAGLNCEVMSWDAAHKGLDDYLLAELGGGR